MLGYKLLIAAMLAAVVLVPAQAQQRDPTRPPQSGEVQKTTNLPAQMLELQAIQLHENDRWAQINGQKLRENEFIGIYQVIRIDLSKVILEANGKQVIVRMYQSVKQSQEAHASTTNGGRK
ncbi:MAG: general secretion pathway protein GspB [Idiomarina sp.]